MTTLTASMAYRYAHTDTQATTGYFTCLPPATMHFNDCLTWLVEHPLDSFMHSHLLRKIVLEDIHKTQNYIQSLPSYSEKERLIFATLLYEACTLDPKRQVFCDAILVQIQHDGHTLIDLCTATPLPHLTWASQEQRDLQQAWMKVFIDNMHQHHMLPHPEDDDLEVLYSTEVIENFYSASDKANTFNQNQAPTASIMRPSIYSSAPLAALYESMKAEAEVNPTAFPAWQRPPAQETADRALAVLEANNIIAGPEMRHEASLSPIALLRRWNLNLQVAHGRHTYTLCGEATTYGRGLSVADARASYLMEMVERASSYASIGPEGILGLAPLSLQETVPLADLVHDEASALSSQYRQAPLVHARYSELIAQGHMALDPRAVPSEIDYADQPLHWLEAYLCPPHEANDSKIVQESILVPVQLVYLFNNLDEIDLAMAPSSTGLASGNTLAEAKLSALIEIIERDAEATTPYIRQHCFRATSDDPRLMGLLNDYAARGMHVHFQDMTSFTGLPCYTCFVMSARGVLARGTGAGLDGKRAALSAMTETPYPYPHGGPSAPPLRELPERKLEDLPSFLLSSPEHNLRMVERCFMATGRRPIYANLSQARFGIPVVKALVPHMEPTADFDGYSRVSKRLYANYLSLFDE